MWDLARPACLEMSWNWMAGVGAVTLGLVPWAIDSNHDISRARNRADGLKALKSFRCPKSPTRRPVWCLNTRKPSPCRSAQKPILSRIESVLHDQTTKDLVCARHAFVDFRGFVCSACPEFLRLRSGDSGD